MWVSHVHTSSFTPDTFPMLKALARGLWVAVEVSPRSSERRRSRIREAKGYKVFSVDLKALSLLLRGPGMGQEGWLTGAGASQALCAFCPPCRSSSASPSICQGLAS